MTLALEILTLALGAVAMLVAIPAAPQRRRSKPRPAPPLRPEDLERVERLVVTGRSTAAEVHLRLRPVLREIAAARLRRRGVQLNLSRSDARELLGEELWELVRPDRPRPEDLRGPGISLELLAAMTDRLEAL